MYALKGRCHCGNLEIELTLSRAPEGYNPRACDCDFCTQHAAAYLSDPQGRFTLRVKDGRKLSRYHQGSDQAEFLICSECGALAGVTYQSGAQLYGAVNARIIEGGEVFGEKQVVSPKRLSADEKSTRWQEVWFPEVEVLIA